MISQKAQKFLLTILESQKLTRLKFLDTEKKISQIEWTLHNGHIKLLSYCSDLIEYHSSENNQKLQ